MDGVMNRQWWEVQVQGEPGLEEVLFEVFVDCGCQGTVSQLKDGQMKVCSYLPHLQTTETERETIAQQLQQAADNAAMTVQGITWHAIAEEDWANSWKEHWHPTEIGHRLLIYPAWLELPPESDRLLIRLDPGVAFGTGAHASTQLCLLLLEAQYAQDNPGEILADIGCGSGILAIAALKLGAKQVYAVDTDLLAVDSTAAARALNNLPPDRLPVAQGSIETVLSQLQAPVDGFCCNILAPVILELIPSMTQLTQVGGWGILSGILQTQVPPLVEAFAAQGWQLSQSLQQGDWAALKMIRH
jgi:ribosomal protein L11 methyltransferase